MTEKNIPTSERLELKTAAKALSVSVRTVQRYIERGLLTRVKERGRIFVIPDEVKILKKKLAIEGKTTATKLEKKVSTVTIELSYLENLMKKLAQLEEKQKFMLTYQEDLQKKDMTLKEKELSLVEKETEIQKLKDSLKRLKGRNIVQRIFNVD
jgi:predicted site-specific integrase-resolvase